MLSRIIRILTLSVLLVPVFACAAASTTPLAVDLQADGRLARETGRPVLVFFMSSSCPYCEEVRSLYLDPMVRSGSHDDRLIIRMVDINSAAPLRDFAGNRIGHDRFASDHGASFTPVLKFFDDQGKELVPELLGYTSPDFYLFYLEQAIDRSVAALRSGKSSASGNPPHYARTK
jgi:thioredoxin-related protein